MTDLAFAMSTDNSSVDEINYDAWENNLQNTSTKY